MNPSSETTIATLASQDHRTIQVFEKYGIDFCCRGNKTLSEACADSNINLGEVQKALSRLRKSPPNDSMDFDNWSLDLLADYIEKKHHRYVNETLPLLKNHLNKIVSVHGEQHPELSEINKLFLESAGEFTAHMKKEELILFPFIRKLVQMNLKQEAITEPSAAGAVQHPIRMMMHDHDAEGERFRRIAALSNNYTPPADACTTYKITYTMLQEFEKDLHLHIHLENNILFPGAIALETRLIRQ